LTYSTALKDGVLDPGVFAEVRDEVIEKAEQGKSVTLKELKELQAKYEAIKDEANRIFAYKALTKNTTCTVFH
jgi:ABC-type Zn uptake system ZnuABC Zn-binding protein ZnuA